MKKKILLIFLVFFFFSLGLILFFLENKKEALKKELLIPTPTMFQINPPFSPDLIKEKEAESNYSLERQKFLKEKPWTVYFPLQSSNYFIFYDSEEDQIIIKLYYSPFGPSKEEQIKLIKQDAVSELTKMGISLNKEKVVFIEKEK